MAYVPNQLSITSQTIEGNWDEAIMFGTDPIATVLGANYIYDGQKRGLNFGDVVWYNNGTTTYLTQVTGVQTGGSGVTLSLLSAGTGTGVSISNAAITANTGTTLPGAAIVGGLISRTGPTAAFTDTTDTAANIIAAMNSQTIGNAWTVRILNNTAYPQTLAAGSGVTLSGATVIPPLSFSEMLVTYSAAGAITIQGYEVGQSVSLPGYKLTTAALAAGTLAAAQISGANDTVLSNTGATPGTQTLPTAASVFAAIPNCQAGFSYGLRIVNTGAGTLTVAADGGATWTVTGHAAVATNTFVDYIVTFASATAATLQSIGSGVSP